jgi:imidazolonepropionase-like amidohydrolase
MQCKALQHTDLIMTTQRILPALLLGFSLFSAQAQAQAEEEATKPSYTLIQNVNIFDGVNDRLKPGHVLIENNLIKEVGAITTVPKGTTVIDGGGRTLMPGLIDAHVHLTFSGTADAIPDREAMRWDQLGGTQVLNAREFLMDGFTTVRDAGACYDGIKKLVDRGLLVGPRIYPSGGILSQTSGHADWRAVSERNPNLSGARDNNLGRLGLMHLVDGVPRVLAATRQNLAAGATQIKMTTGGGVSSTLDPLHTVQFLPEEIEAAVRVARDWDTYVMVHAYTAKTVKRSLQAGVLCIEHGQMMDDEAMAMLVEKEAFLSPNMAALSVELLQHPVYGRGVFAIKTRQFIKGSKGFVNLVKKHNPKVVYNTDVVATDLVGSRGVRDNNLWVHADSFGNFDTLRAMTSVGGELMALTGKHNPYPAKLGVIEPGAYADIILVEGNPLEDIKVLGARPKMFEGKPRKEEGFKTMPFIMKDGKVYKNTLK